MERNELINLVKSRRETRTLDYKSEVNPASKQDVVALAKDVTAFANTRGGTIIVGVDDSTFDAVGVKPELLKALRPEDLDNKINEYPEPRVDFEVSTFTYQRKSLIAIEVATNAEQPCVMKKEGNYPEPSSGRTKNAFPRGAIFVRHGAKSSPATRRDIERMFRERLERERRSILDGMRRVVEAGPDAQVIVEPSTGLRLTTDPNAQGVRAVLDTRRMTSIGEELTAGVKLWKTTGSELASDHQLYRFYARRSDLSLDSERSEFLLRSSLVNYLPGCFWASHLESRRLKTVLEDVVGGGVHPAEKEALKLVYLLGGEFARRILSSVSISSPHTSAKKAALSLLSTYNAQFTERVRILTHQASSRIRYMTSETEKVVDITAALRDKNQAKDTATEIARELSQNASADYNKGTLKRLDIGIYASLLKGKSRD